MEEKRQKLFEKMYSEQQAYIENLFSLPKEKIIEHAHEYVVRNTILKTLPEIAISDTVYDKLLSMKDVLKEAEECYSSVEDDIADAVSITLIEIAGEDTSMYMPE